MSTHRARTALCTLAVAVAALVSTVGTGGAGAAEQARAGGAALVLTSQTPWVTAAQPWFNLAVGVSPSAGAPGSLSVSVSFYGRVNDASDLQQAISGTPNGNPLLRETGIPVSGSGGLAAATCVTVVPNSSTAVPATGDGICPAGGRTLALGCQALADECGDVYPVSVALVRQGSSTPVARFTTFLTYQQPNAVSSTGGALRVGIVLPVSASGLTTMADALTNYRDVPTTLAVSPLAVSQVGATRARDGARALAQLAALSGDEVSDQPYVPINLAALTGAGLSGEIGAQLSRGDDILRAAGLKPDGGAWVDTSSTLTQGDAANLASGLQAAGATQTVVSDSDLASAGLNNYTFAQPFTLDMGHGSTIPAAAANSTLSARASLPRRPTRSSGPSSCWPGSRSSTSRTPSSARPAGSWWSRPRDGGPPPPSSTRCSAASRATLPSRR